MKARTFLISLAIAAASTSLTAAPLDSARDAVVSEVEPTALATQSIAIGSVPAQVEIADTPAAWRQGLTGRTHLGEDAGMLFLFPTSHTQSFWMKDVPIPLDVAFLDDEKRIFQIELMSPNTRTLHVSKKPCRYVLEMPGGWFARRGIRPGTPVAF